MLFSFRFSVGKNKFWKRAFWKWWHLVIHAISLPEVSSNTNRKWPLIVAFSNFRGSMHFDAFWEWKRRFQVSLCWRGHTSSRGTRIQDDKSNKSFQLKAAWTVLYIPYLNFWSFVWWPVPVLLFWHAEQNLSCTLSQQRSFQQVRLAQPWASWSHLL